MNSLDLVCAMYVNISRDAKYSSPGELSSPCIVYVFPEDVWP